MKTSQVGLDFIAKWEGVVLKPYKDVAGLRTIGVGHLIQAGENFPDGIAITKERAFELLAEDVKKCEEAISRAIKVTLTQSQFDALVSFGFNCGVGVYTTSSACRALNAGDHAGFAAGLLMWDKAKVKGVMTPVAGLTARRRAEVELFNSQSQGPATAQFFTWTKEALMEAQQKLQSLGLYQKKIDGLWGPGTDAALKAYAAQAGIPLSAATSSGVPVALLEKLREIS